MKAIRRLRVLWARMRALFAQRRANREFDDELQQHIQLLTERFLSQGMSRQAAADAARRQFGNAALLQQRQREARTFLFLSTLWCDLSFGARMLRKHPGSTVGVIVALALGIGMNACVFTFVNALLLRPATGFKAPNEMREVWEHPRNASGIGSFMPLTYPDYAFFRDHARSFSGILAYDGDPEEIIWNRSGRGQVLHGQLVSGNAFSVAGVGVAMGRAFTPADDQPTHPRPLVILRHSFWKQRLGSDRDIIGKSIMLNGMKYDVIGVAQPGFTGFEVAMAPDFWTPLSMVEQLVHDPGRLTSRNSNWLLTDGRLAAGQTTKSAQAEMSVLARELELAHADTNKDMGETLFTFAPVPGPFRGYVTAFTGMLMAVFGLVLVIACTNAASLLMVKSTGRAREMAIRSALGAGRGRLIRQMTVESLLLSLIAGCTAVLLASLTSHLLLNLIPTSLPISIELPLDWRVLAFTFLVALVTGIVFGVTPALRGTRIDPVQVIKAETHSGGYRQSRLRTVIMIGEVAVCALLLFSATLCVRSLLNAGSIDPGFDTQNIVVATLDAGSLGYSDVKVEAFYRELATHIRALPGVFSTSYVNHLPLDTSREQTSVSDESLAGAKPKGVPVDVFRVDPGYFKTMGVPLLGGRGFAQGELERKANVIVVNGALALRLWPGQNPIGKLITVGDAKVRSQVIGVVKTGKYRSLGEEPIPALFRMEMPPRRVLVVHTLADPGTLLDAVQREVQIVDPNMAATEVQTIGKFMSLPMFAARTTGLLLGASGFLALALTWIGLYGVISFAVSERTREIGVRMAMGAGRGDVMKLIMRQGLFVTGFGLVIGIGAALASARLLSSLLYGIRPDDPATVVAVVAGMTAVTMLACYIPARRAMRVNPVIALRYE
jgi:predicted permease